MTVVILVSILLMLTGAFMQVNRTHFGMINNRQDQEDARSACLAAYNYTLYKLEHDRNWAKGLFDGSDDPILSADLRVTQVLDTHDIVGDFPGRKASFKATILNNLNETTVSPEGVPPGCAKILIQGTARNSVRSASGLIHVAPLFDASVISRRSLTVDAENLAVRSVDPYRNLVRAEDQISIPQVLTASKTRFMAAGSSAPDSKGTIWSRGGIQTGDPSGGYQSISGSNVVTANANSGGRFVPNAEQHFEVHDLKASDIKVPSNKSTLDSGEYRFTKADARVQYTAYRKASDPVGYSGTVNADIHVLEHYDDPNDPMPARVFRTATRDNDLKDQIRVPNETGTGTVRPEKVVINDLDIDYGLPGTPPDIKIGDNHNLDREGRGTVLAELGRQTITVKAGTTVETDRDLMVTSRRGDRPTLTLGSKGNPPALVAGGSLKLENALTDGVGTLVALDGDVSFQPLSSSLSVNTSKSSRGLVVFASNDIKMTNPDPGGDWRFRGLIYARGGFEFDANGANTRLDGTIVSLGADLNITRANQVELVYNPAYLELVESNMPLNRLQIERLVWRE